MITLHLCPFGNRDGKTSSETVIQGIAKPGESLLYISPSGRRAEEAGKSFSDHKEKREFYSLDRFIEKILKDVKGCAPGRYIDDKFRFILIQEILSSEGKYASLFNRSSGTISVLSELIFGFKYYGYGKNTGMLKKKLCETLLTFDRVRERAVFAVEILEKYQEKIKELNFMDDIDRLEKAAEVIKVKKMKFDRLILDGFFDVPEAQKSFFSGLIEASAGTSVIHYGEERLEEIKNIKSSFLDFVRSLGECKISNNPAAGKPRLPKDCSVHKALSVDEEVKQIARKILLVRKSEPGRPWSEIMVTFPSMFAYIPYVKRIFPKYDIPFSTSVDMPYLTVPQIIPVALLLRCLLEEFPRRTVVDILSSKGFSVFTKEAREFVSPVSRKAGITGGLIQWAELEERLRNEEPAYFEAHGESIEELKKGLKLFFASLEKLNNPLTLKDFIAGLRNALKTFKYTIKDKNLSEGFFDMLFGMETTLGVFKGKVNEPKENARLFMNILSRSAYKEESKGGDSLRVLGIMDTRGLYFRHLFFGGLADGDYPVKPKQEMIIPDKARKELGLVHFQRKIELQKLDFYRLLQAPEESAALSYPSQKDGRLVLVSNFLPEAGGLTGKITELKPETKEELQRAAGRLSGKPAAAFNAVEFADKNKAAAYISALFSGKAEISVTAIDRYLDCPFLFYLEKILGLETLEEPRFEIESAHIGTILHSVMAGGFSTGKKDNKALKNRLLASTRKELKDTLLHDFWKEHIIKRMDALLIRILKQESELSESYSSIYCLEKKGRFKLPGGKTVIKGRIDRVDCGDRVFMVIDYKSGSGARGYFDRTRKGESIQLPLYARMIAAERPDLAVDGFCVYDLKEGRARIVKAEKVPELYEKSLETAGKAVAGILNGDFPKKEEYGRGSCWSCSYASLCKR